MRIAAFIAAGVLGLLSLGLLAGGGILLWADSQKDEDGFVTTESARFATDAYAMSTDKLDVDSLDWIVGRDRWGKLRLEIEPRGDKPLFAGIARTADVDRYLRGVHHDLVTNVEIEPFRADYRERPGDARPTRPAAHDFWAASAHGAGRQTLTWDVEDGDWAVVVMNEDASRGVDASVEAGADIPFLSDAGWVSLAGGLFAIAIAATLAFLGIRRRTAARV
jgi:hypothetical protein